MRRALLLGAVLLAGCGSAPRKAGGMEVTRGSAGRGAITLFVANGTDRRQTLAQVAVDDGFVPLPGPPRSVAPHATVRVEVPYPVVRGEAYRIAVLTGTGDKLEYRLGG